MATKTSYSHARQHLARLWDRVEDSREAAVIQRPGHEDMALLPADELTSLAGNRLSAAFSPMTCASGWTQTGRWPCGCST
jgi:Antitoxin Phd_YefM, type II toxin-antitoxin system